MSTYWDVKPGQLQPDEHCHYGSLSKLSAIAERRALRTVGVESQVRKLRTEERERPIDDPASVAAEGVRWCVIVREQ